MKGERVLIKERKDKGPTEEVVGIKKDPSECSVLRYLMKKRGEGLSTNMRGGFTRGN